MPMKRKLGISSVFATGIFANITSIIWLVKIIQYASNPDFSYNAAIVGEWTVAELTAGIVCGCMPVLPQFFRQSIPKASACLRGYWTRTLHSPVSTNRSHKTLAAKPSWETHNPVGDYLKLDERHKPFPAAVTRESLSSSWKANQLNGEGGQQQYATRDVEDGREENGG
ncbi:MAG: hypothetical protein Q9187_001062 [Circinaria calcarea]